MTRSEERRTANPELGRLERINVRQAWDHEAHQFTPWLSENLAQLSDALNIDLELEGTEMRVSPSDPFRADIVARIPQDDTRVLIENQLKDANLQHLGQVLAYLAGLEAKIVVWIATGFREPHLSAIRWLNEHTASPFAFFAVQLEVVRIGESKPAPVFKVLERPNEWERQVENTATKEKGWVRKFREDFWAHFTARHPDAPGLRAGWAGKTARRLVDEETDIYVVQFLAQKRIGVYLTGGRGKTKEDVWPQVEPYIDLLQEALADEPVRIHSKTHLCITELKIDSQDRKNWDRMADWLHSRRVIYEQVFRRDGSDPMA